MFWALLFVLMTAVAGCMEPDGTEHGDDVGGGVDGGGQDGTGTSADDPASGSLEVEMRDFVFDPKEVWVEPGTEVTWLNAGSVVHTATAEDGSWDSGDVAPGKEFSQTFDEMGDLSYVCVYHQAQGMVGTIHVVSG